MTTPPAKFKLGIIAAKTFDDAEFLEEKLGPHLGKLGQLFTNGVNKTVMDFALANGVVHTVFPIHAGNTAPWSNSRIIENSDKVYILSTPNSHNSVKAKTECERQGKPYEVFEFEPLLHWKEKVCQVQEILESLPKDENNNETIKAIKGIL